MPENLTIELVIQDGNADVAIGRNKQKLQEFVRDVEKAQPKIKFNIPNQNYIDLDKLEKRAAETRKQFQNITASRLDSGQISGLTRELVKAQERSRILASDISNIKKELANPNRKSSIAFLTEELRGAEKEASQLERKLQTLGGTNTVDGKNAVDGFTRMVGGRDGTKLSAFQKQNLSYQANDVISGLAMGQSPLQILTQQSGQIAQIFSPAQATALVAAYAPLVGILAGGAAAIALTYKVTGDIRAEAERRLKVEEKLTSEFNKQNSLGFEIRENYRKQGIEAQKNFEFNKFLDQNNNLNSLDFLRQRKKTLETLGDVNSRGDDTAKEASKKQLEEARRIGDQLRDLEEQNKNLAARSADNAMRLRQDGLSRQLEMNAEAEKRRLANLEKFAKSVEDGKKKIEDWNKTVNSVYDNIYSKFYQNNPIALAMIEGDKAVKQLEDSLKGLPPQLQGIAQKALVMQKSLNADNEFRARLNNKFQVFDLQESANNFRNPIQSQDEINKQKKEYFDRAVNQGFDFYQNPGAAIELEQINSTRKYLERSNLSEQDRKNAENELNRLEQSKYSKTLIANLNSINADGQFSSLNRDSLISALTRDQINKPVGSLSLQERVDKQIGIVNSLNPVSDSEKSIANQKIIQLTQGIDPNQLNPYQRDQAAMAREREAIRISKNEDDAKQLRKEELQVKKDLTEAIKKFNEIAEKDGIKAILEIVDKSNGSVNIREGRSPSRRDTEKLYQ